MNQADRGTKRHCPNCGAAYYDLNRQPVTCPKCHAEYVAQPKVPLRAGGRGARPAPLPIPEEPSEDRHAFAEDEALEPDEDGDEALTESPDLDDEGEESRD